MPNVIFNLDCLKQLLRDVNLERTIELADKYGLRSKVIGSELEVEVTAERPDLLSIEGFARVINLFSEIQQPTECQNIKESDMTLTVSDSITSIRPYIAALVAENVNFREGRLKEFLKFQEKISDTFGRKRRRAAVGAYDLSKISGNISYSAEEVDRIEFIPIGGNGSRMCAREILRSHPKGIEYSYLLAGQSRVPIIKDGLGNILSMPPIVNSNISPLNDSTSFLFLEVSGESKPATRYLANLIAQNMADSGATINKVKIDYPDKTIITPDLVEGEILIDPSKVNSLLGTSYSDKDIVRILKKMGLHTDDGKVVRIPAYRSDILGYPDITAEILIGSGLERLLVAKEIKRGRRGKPSEIKSLTAKICNISQKMGLEGVTGFILCDSDNLRYFSENQPVKATNTKSKSYEVCRDTIQLSLAEILSNNLHESLPLNIYEVGEVVQFNAGQMYETTFWGFGSLGPNVSFATAKSYMTTMLQQLKLDFSLSECNLGRYIQGRSAYVLFNNEVIGHFGEIHPKILNAISIQEPIASGELDCRKLCVK